MTWHNKCPPVFKSMVAFVCLLAVTRLFNILIFEWNYLQIATVFTSSSYLWNWTFFYQSGILEAFTCCFSSENWKNLRVNHYSWFWPYFYVLYGSYNCMCTGIRSLCRVCTLTHLCFIKVEIDWLICWLIDWLIDWFVWAYWYFIFILLRSQSKTEQQCAQSHSKVLMDYEALLCCNV